MSTFYIVSKSYDPGSASTNHALSFIRGFDALGVKAKWIFIFPNVKCSKVDVEFENISVEYLWSDRCCHNKYLRQIYKHYSYGVFFYRTIKKGDTVLLLGAKVYLRKLSSRKDIRVFHELTEHPDVGKMSRLPIFTTKMYMKWVKRVDGLFVITKALKEYFVAQGVDEKIVHVVNMVVDDKRFESVEKQQIPYPYIAYCGNASNTKDGVDDLIRAFSIVAEKNNDIRLCIIGPRPEEGSVNDSLVRNLKVADRVDFIGCVSPSEMPQLLVNAEIVALARPASLQNTYGFPTKLGEYLLSGNPVCVTEVGDIPLFLKHQRTALLSPCGDFKAFAKNLIWCLEYPEAAKQIGQRGRDVAQHNFNLLVESQKILDVICPKMKKQ